MDVDSGGSDCHWDVRDCVGRGDIGSGDRVDSGDDCGDISGGDAVGSGDSGGSEEGVGVGGMGETLEMVIPKLVSRDWFCIAR